jgi:hypothetical protein
LPVLIEAGKELRNTAGFELGAVNFRSIFLAQEFPQALNQVQVRQIGAVKRPARGRLSANPSVRALFFVLNCRKK